MRLLNGLGVKRLKISLKMRKINYMLNGCIHNIRIVIAVTIFIEQCDLLFIVCAPWIAECDENENNM